MKVRPNCHYALWQARYNFPDTPVIRKAARIQSTREMLSIARGGQSVIIVRVVIVAVFKVLLLQYIDVTIAVADVIFMAFYVFPQALQARKAPSIILNPRNELFQKDQVPAVINIGGVDYTRAKALASNRKSTSAVWKFGEKVIRRSDRQAFFYCYDCEDRNKEQPLVVVKGTSNAHHHLRASHNRDADTGEIISGPDEKKKDSDIVKSFVAEHSLSAFKALLIRWFVVCQLAFYMLENDVFRELIMFLSLALAAWLPKAGSALRGWIIDEYRERKELLKAELQASVSKISVAFDIWTAGSWLGIISVWGYWVDAAGVRQRRLLAFRRIYRSHSGENQAAIILEVLEEYEVNKAQKIGWFVCDSASSNDAAVAQVLRSLDPAISNDEIAGRRLWCLGHIINLSAGSLLDPTASERAVAASELDIDEFTSADSWHSAGSIGKLQKLVKYILESPQRREEFSKIPGGRKAMEYDHFGVSSDFLNLRRFKV
jgi:hypothetical protein